MKSSQKVSRILIVASLLWLVVLPCSATAQTSDSDSQRKLNAEDARVSSETDDIQLTIQNVDISHFPVISLIVEAVKKTGEQVDTLALKELSVLENGKLMKVTSVKKISNRERIPVDFMFVIDVTGTMQQHINGVKNNIETFVENLVRRGIDYRLGLVTFSDVVEKTYEPTEDVKLFGQWLSKLYATGGRDEKENALEALAECAVIKYRPAANRVAVIITDAPYHQQGERGDGRTSFTTNSMIDFLKKNQIRAFCIAPNSLEEFARISQSTRGNVFDISQPFSRILDGYSTQLTNLYALTYRSDETKIPDSINVAILSKNKTELIRKTIPIGEIGRKFIIENLLFKSASATLSESIRELDILAEYMNERPKVMVRIEGHTDNRGNQEKNRLLSLSRAESVRDYLVRRRIAGDRIQCIGFGDLRPIAENNTLFGRTLNRRTEIVITSK